MLKQRYVTAPQYARAVKHGLGLHPSRRYSRSASRTSSTTSSASSSSGTDSNAVRTRRAEGVHDDQAAPAGGSATRGRRLRGLLLRTEDPRRRSPRSIPTTGEIVALASSQHYSGSSQFNFAAQAHRQPGSSFKPFVLTTAIKQGVDPNSTYYDGSSPKTLTLPGGGAPWTVNNAEPGKGTMSLTRRDGELGQRGVRPTRARRRRAAVRRHRLLDGDHVAARRHRPRPSLQARRDCYIPPAAAIGGLSEGVTPLEMASAYATLADGGVRHAPTAIAKVVFPDGHVDRPAQRFRPPRAHPGRGL